MLITNGNAGIIAIELKITTIISIMFGASYIAKLIVPFNPNSKEISFDGLFVNLVGFVNFRQNLMIEGFMD